MADVSTEIDRLILICDGIGIPVILMIGGMDGIFIEIWVGRLIPTRAISFGRGGPKMIIVGPV